MVAFVGEWRFSLHDELFDDFICHRPCETFEAANLYDLSIINTLGLASSRRLSYPEDLSIRPLSFTAGTVFAFLTDEDVGNRTQAICFLVCRSSTIELQPRLNLP